VVWQRDISLLNQDVRGQRLSAAGSLIGGTLSIESSSTSASRPRVANVNMRDAFVVAWQQAGDIQARGVDSATGVLSVILAVAATADTETQVDLAGEISDSADDDALCVWANTTTGDIEARQITYTATGTLGQTVVVTFANPLFSTYSNPCISRNGGGAGTFLICWDSFGSLSNKTTVRGTVVNRNLGVAVPDFQVATHSFDARDPACDGDGDRGHWVVAFEREESAGGDTDVYCVPVHLAGATPVLGLEAPIDNGASDDERDPAVCWLQDSCLVAWSDEASASNYDTYVTSLSPLRCDPCEGRFLARHLDGRHFELSGDGVALPRDQRRQQRRDDRLAGVRHRRQHRRHRVRAVRRRRRRDDPGRRRLRRRRHAAREVHARRQRRLPLRTARRRRQLDRAAGAVAGAPRLCVRAVHARARPVARLRRRVHDDERDRRREPSARAAGRRRRHRTLRAVARHRVLVLLRLRPLQRRARAPAVSHPMHQHFPLVLTFASVFGSAGFAQDPTGSTLVGVRQALDRGHAIVVEQDGALCASGRHYKAAFGDGMVFTPALGDAVPHNQELRYRLRSIRRGDGIVFADVGTDAPVIQRGERRVTMVHAAGLTERFDARPDGVEVSYEFAERPAGHGDLVVAAAITTALQPEPRADGSFAFVLPGLGGVTVGHVTGIDADGDTVRGSLHLHGDRLELRLPAEFVDAASYPLVLDPLIGTEFQIGVNDDSDADVGYQHSVGLYLVAWKRRFSAFDHDIYAQFLSPAGVLQGAPVWVDATVDVCSRPRVGSVPTSSQYVIVYEKAPSPFGPFQVVCRTLQAGGALSAITTVAAPAGNAKHASVGSEITNADDDLLVAYETDDGIEAREITVPPAGAVAVGAPAVLSINPAADEPEISRSGGLLGYWMVVWSLGTSADRELAAAVVDRTRTILAHGLVPFTNNALDDSHPAVDGDGSTFVVAYQQQEAPGSSLHDIRGARLQFTGTGITVATIDVPIEANPGQDERRPHTTWLGPKHCVVFEEQIGATNTGIGAWLVDDTCALCNAKMVFDGLNPTAARNREFGARAGGRWQFASNGVYDDGFLVFAEADDVPPFAGSVICQQVQALGNGQAPVQVGAGCGNGGTSSVGGGSPFVIGSQYFTFYVNGLEPAAVPFFGLGLPGPTLGCGACVLTSPVLFEFLPNVAGAAQRPFPLTCDPAYVGTTVEFQWVSFLTSRSPCPLAAGLSASNRMQITLTN
jgi:hypothetical protein